MENSTAGRVGRWSKLFGLSKPFAWEVAKAKEVAASWSVHRDMGHAFVVLDPMEGHVEPALGSDEKWIYARRPEGVWKTKWRDDAFGLRTTLLAKPTPDASLRGTCVDAGFRGRGGWTYGSQDSMTPADIDEMRRPPADGPPMDEVGDVLFDFLEFSEERAVVRAGDSLSGAAVEFTLVDDWLLARENRSGFVVGYEVSGNRVVRERLLAGKLWLRFEGPWMPPVDARVTLARGGQR